MNFRIASSMRRIHSCVALVVLSGSAQIARAQAPAQPSDTRVVLDAAGIAKADALAAIKRGDFASAIARVEAAVRADGASHRDLQVADQLGQISFVLKNESNGARAREAASAAIERLRQPTGRMQPTDAARASQLMGQLYESVLDDPAKAKAAYQQAVDIEPRLSFAQARLQHITATEEAAKAKERANAILVERARASKK